MPEIAPMKLNDLISDLNRAQKYLKDETEEPGAWLMSKDCGAGRHFCALL